MGLDMYLVPQYEGETLEEVINKFDPRVCWRKAYEIDDWFRSHGTPHQTEQEKNLHWDPFRWIITPQIMKEFLKYCVENLISPSNEDLREQCRMSLREIADNLEDHPIQWIYTVSE